MKLLHAEARLPNNTPHNTENQRVCTPTATSSNIICSMLAALHCTSHRMPRIHCMDSSDPPRNDLADLACVLRRICVITSGELHDPVKFLLGGALGPLSCAAISPSKDYAKVVVRRTALYVPPRLPCAATIV